MVESEVFGDLEDSPDGVESCVAGLDSGTVACEWSFVVRRIHEPSALQELIDFSVGLSILQKVAWGGVWISAVIWDFVCDNAVGALFWMRSAAFRVSFWNEHGRNCP